MIVLQEYVLYRGEQLHIARLPPHTTKKIKVRCPNCNKERMAYWRVVRNVQHSYCQKCTKRMQRKILPVGELYGRLRVIKPSDKSGYTVCKCSCGVVKEHYNYCLTSGQTKSCGCLKKENFNNITRATREKHGRWKGGITDVNQSIRQSVKYKQWRTFVYERDDYTCQKCSQVGYELNCHHIKPFSLYEDLRFDIDNGITLCKECHNEFHSIYGRKDIGFIEVSDFLNNSNNDII